MQVGVLVGPAIGGLLVAYVGIGWCFLVDVGGLAVASLLFALMRRYPHRDETTPPSLRGIGEGCATRSRRRDLLGTYLVDIAAMLLAIPVVLFPALAEEVFEQAAAARPPLLRRDRRRPRGDRAQRLDRPGAPPRPGHRPRGRGVRRLHRARRPDALDLAGRASSSRSPVRADMISRRLPRHGLEPDHPRADARPAGRHRDAVLLGRPARRPGPRRRRRRPVVGARRDHQRRRRLRRRCRR